MIPKRIKQAARVALTLLLIAVPVLAQSPSELATGLKAPVKIVFTDDGNLLVGECGEGPNSGRVSFVDRCGTRRTLIDGLPSGVAAMGDPSGPGGLARNGVTLYIAIGGGDATRSGLPGQEIPNPAGPSSPVLSSVISATFDVDVDQLKSGFTLTRTDHDALKAGGSVVKTNAEGFKATFTLVADFPDLTPDPIANTRPSNPFALALSGDQLFVADASQNSIRRVNLLTGAVDNAFVFPPQPNPLPFGPPVFEAVPNGLTLAGGQLLISFLTGFPFPAGRSDIRAANLASGAVSTLISGLTTAIDIIATGNFAAAQKFYVLEYSTNFLADAPGRVLRFDGATAPAVVVAQGIPSPTGMARDERTGDIFVSEFFEGRIVQLPGDELNLVIRDDDTGDILRFNRFNGDYYFISCRTQTVLTGSANIYRFGCTTYLYGGKVFAGLNTCTDSGFADIRRSVGGGQRWQLTDTDTSNSSVVP